MSRQRVGEAPGSRTGCCRPPFSPASVRADPVSFILREYPQTKSRFPALEELAWIQIISHRLSPSGPAVVY